jgi:amino acid transporter
VANIVTWSLGCNRVAAAAAIEGALPRVLGRLHPRYDTPHMAFVIMGSVATGLLLGNAALAGRSDNVFWMMFKLSGVCFLVTYLLVFPAFLVLREKRPDQPRSYVMPGGRLGAWAACLVCWLFIAGAILLFFWPSPESENPWFESGLLVGETLLTLGLGLWLMPRRGERPEPAQAV